MAVLVMNEDIDWYGIGYVDLLQYIKLLGTTNKTFYSCKYSEYIY